MDVEQALQVANSALFTQIGRWLTVAAAAILLGSLQSQTYEQIAEADGVARSYLKRDVGPKLWKLLEQALGKPISKTNCRSALEARWRNSVIAATQTQNLAADALTDIANNVANNLFASPANSPFALSIPASTSQTD